MKIGIITLNSYFNYGNRLQNYALQTYLNELADNIMVDTIWYTKDNYKPRQKLLTFKNFRRFILNRHGFRDEISKGLIFNEVIKQYNIKKFSDKYISTIFDYEIKDDLNDRYDFFVVGSDQIWNPIFVDCKNEFLQFADFNKRIAYSASIGVSEIPENKKVHFSECINGMKHISVREEQGAKIVRSITGMDVPVLVDPTLLLNRESWEKIIRKPDWMKNKKYILVFFLEKLPQLVRKEVERLAIEHNLKVIELMNKENIDFYTNSPDEFLWLIKNATLVYTDSFHCTVFSIIWNVPFVNCSREHKEMNMDSRMDTLLGLFNLRNRKTDKSKKYIIENPLEIKYPDVEKILEPEREKSRKYLMNALELKA